MLDLETRKMNGMWIDFAVTVLVAIYFNTCSFWILFRPIKIVMSKKTEEMLLQYDKYVNDDCRNETRKKRPAKQILSDLKVQIRVSQITREWGNFIFTFFPMLMISFTLAVSIFNQSLLSFGYMLFVMFLIEDSKNFFKTEEGGHKRLHFILKYLLLPYLLVDILLQLIYQMPVEEFMQDRYRSQVVGFGRVWVIDPPVVTLGENTSVSSHLNRSLASLMMKGITFFLISVQI